MNVVDIFGEKLVPVRRIFGDEAKALLILAFDPEPINSLEVDELSERTLLEIPHVLRAGNGLSEAGMLKAVSDRKTTTSFERVESGFWLLAPVTRSIFQEMGIEHPLVRNVLD